MARYLRLWMAWARVSLGRETLFRGNFWLRMLAHGLWLGSVWLFFEAIYAHVPVIAGWRREQVWLLLAVNGAAQQLYGIFVGRGLLWIPDLIWQGEMDSILTKPVSPLFTLSVGRMRLYDLPALALPLTLGGVALRALGLRPTPGQWLWFGLLVLLGIAARYAITLAVVSSAFWVTRVYAMPALLAELFQLAGYPAEVFRGATRIVFTFVVPVLAVANFPVQVLLGEPAPLRLALALGGVGLWTTVAATLWRAGLGRYTAVGG